ncbi:MAG: PAS domain-containing protein, partial [Anaerolineae bacterium]|nr:PAS domain-containing protein [Anaerolineae bacterium]
QRLAQAQRIAHLGNWQVIFASDNQAERNIWSDESFRILGLEPGREDPGFDLFLQHLDPEERERLRQYIEVKIQQGEDYSHECRIHRRDG